MRNHIEDGGREQCLKDLAYTLTAKRTSFPWKSVAMVSPNPTSELNWSMPMRPKQRMCVCYVFTGQGAQWYGMGRELLQYEVFRNSMVESDVYFTSLGSDWSLMGKFKAYEMS
jgi:acyl transferase domain-containing protein